MNVLKGKNNHATIMFFNTKIKTFADGSQHVKYHNYISTKGNAKKESSGVLTEEERKRKRYNNLYSTKQNLIDLAYHNALETPWQYFITLEFNANEIDYKNYEKVSELLSKFLDNLKHQNKDMRYIMVPEFHPTTGGVHFHGLLSNVPNLKLKEAINPNNNKIIRKNGSVIYNLINYKLGYSTISEIKNQEAVSVYMAKYMTKQLIDLNYKKRYWSSKNLKRPTIQYAHMTEDYLKFYIDINEIKDYYEGKNLIFFKTSVLHNLSYVNQ